MEPRCALNSATYMTLRTIVLAIAIIGLMASFWGVVLDSAAWPLLVVMAVLCAGLAYERRHYGAALRERPDADWRETEEQFIDDATGDLVRVWYHGATGERRYVNVAGDKAN